MVKKISVNIPDELYKKLEQYNKKYGAIKTNTIKLALNEFLEYMLSKKK